MGLTYDHTASVWMCGLQIQLTNLQLHYCMLSPSPILCPGNCSRSRSCGRLVGTPPWCQPLLIKLGRTADLHSHLNMDGVPLTPHQGIRNLRLCQSEPSYYGNLMQLFLIGRMVFISYLEVWPGSHVAWLGLSVAVRSRGTLEQPLGPPN